MPLPRRFRKVNRGFSNYVTKPFARRLPGFAVLRHTGRRSGKSYETPLNAWKCEGRVVVALTYGPDVDWLANARNAPSTLFMAGDPVRVGPPEDLEVGEGMACVPPIVRSVLAALDVDGFVAFSVLSQPS